MGSQLNNLNFPLVNHFGAILESLRERTQEEGRSAIIQPKAVCEAHLPPIHLSPECAALLSYIGVPLAQSSDDGGGNKT